MAQIFEIVNLANELLPRLPQGTISLPVSTTIYVKGLPITKAPSGSFGKLEDSNETEISTHEKLLKEHPELLQQFGLDLLPVMIQVLF